MCAECHQYICPSACPNAPEPPTPVCPVCGSESDTFYKQGCKVIGCGDCIMSVDAWEEQYE